MSFIEAFYALHMHQADIHFGAMGRIWVTKPYEGGSLIGTGHDLDPQLALIQATVDLINKLEKIRKGEATLEQLLAPSGAGAPQ